MLSSKLKFFSDTSYFALKQMETENVASESDDERIVGEVKEEADDEFSTYFTDQKVQIPEDDKVIKY
jgi:hypothetical protein